MGAWIEITPSADTSLSSFVAPLVGAWIEIMHMGSTAFVVAVAPLVGAWIEIVYIGLKNSKRTSLPSWERGLKLCTYPFASVHGSTSLPSWERGLKFE